MPSSDHYLEAIASTAQPTPRAVDGMRVTLTISLYEPGHAGLDARGAVGLPMNDDEELVRSLATVIAKVRRRM